MGSMNIQYPFVSEGPAESQVQQIKDYLYQLVDQLNLQDFSAEKVFEEVSKAIDADMVANGNNEQAAKLKEYANLKALIIKTGDYSLNHSEEFEKVLKASFSASSDMGQYDEELVQKVKENAEGIERLFDYTAGINNEDGRWGVGTKQFVKTGLLYYDEGQVPVFGVGVGVINKIVAENDTVVDMSQNQLATFTADEIAFWDNGNKVAYVSGNAINFPAANIRGGSIHIGEEERNFFKVDTYGNLQIGDYFRVNSLGIANFKSADGKAELDLSSGEMTFELADEVEMRQSAEGISFFRHDKVDETLTLLKYSGGISVYLNPSLDDSIFYPTAKLSVYDVFDADTGNVLGKLWNNGGTRSQLDIGGAYLRDKFDMNTEYGAFYFHNDSGALRLADSNALTWFHAFVDEDAYSRLELYGTGDAGTGVQLGVSNGSGQISVWNKGAVKGGIVAGPAGAELRLGGGDVSWRMAWNNGESHLQADHHHFLGKSNGLIEWLGQSTASANSSEFSAFIVVGKPSTNSRQSSVIIPSDLTGYYQIADEDYYLDINYSGSSISKNGGSSGSAIIAIYGIR